MIEKIRRRVFDIIQIGNKSDTPSRLFDYFLVLVIVLNILVMFLETFDEMEPYFPVLKAIEYGTMLVFCIEYLLRLWTAKYLYPGENPSKAALKFALSFDGIVDLLTILPFFFLYGFVAFRMLRVVRIFHLFRLNAKYDSFHVIVSVLAEKRKQLASSIFIIFVLMLASSLSMYGVEHDAQPENFRNAFSGIWWSVSALLTVGYGDIYPITTLGRVLGIVIAFLGVAVVAIPTGIISAGFVEQYTELQNGSAAPDVRLRTVEVGLDSAWLGLSFEEIDRQFRYTVVLAKRGASTILPVSGSSYRVEAGDVLAVYLDSGQQS